MKKGIKKLAKALAIAQGEKIISPYFAKSKVETPVDDSKINKVNKRIDELVNYIGNLKYPTFAELNSVISALRSLDSEFKNQESVIKTLSKSNTEVFVELHCLEEALRSEMKLLNSSDTNEIETLAEGIEAMRMEFLSRIANLGGGSMNRQIKIGGIDYLTRYTDINLIGSITAVNNDGQKRVDITFSSPGGSGYQLPLTGVIDGINATYTWTTAPQSIVVDDGRIINKVSADGTQNWTGTTTTIMQVPPNRNIYAIA